MIGELTSEQEALIPKIRNEWISRALDSDGTLDRESSTELVNYLYELSSLAHPEVIFVDSPVAAQYAARLITGDDVTSVISENSGIKGSSKYWKSIEDNVWAKIKAKVKKGIKTRGRDRGLVEGWDSEWDKFGEDVWEDVWARIRAKDSTNVCEKLAKSRNRIRDHIGSKSRNSVPGNVWGTAWTMVMSNVESGVNDALGIWENVKCMGEANIGLGVNSGWLAFYDFFQEIGVEVNPEFSKYNKLLKKSRIWDAICLKGFCIVSPPPGPVKRDQENQLHSEEGPAVEWLDGYCQYYLKGVYFDEETFNKIINQTFVVKVLKEQYYTQFPISWDLGGLSTA